MKISVVNVVSFILSVLSIAWYVYVAVGVRTVMKYINEKEKEKKEEREKQ